MLAGMRGTQPHEGARNGFDVELTKSAERGWIWCSQ
jgi:hypothetical protein